MYFKKIGVLPKAGSLHRSVFDIQGVLLFMLFACAIAFSSSANATWQQSQITGMSSVSLVVGDPVNANTAYAVGLLTNSGTLTSGKYGIFKTTTGGASWQQLNINNLDLASVHQMAFHAKTSSNAQFSDYLVLVGHGPSSITSTLDLVVYKINLQTSTAFKIIDGLERENYANSLVVSQSGWAYFAGQGGIYATNLDVSNTAFPWTLVYNGQQINQFITRLDVVNGSGSSNTLVAIVKTVNPSNYSTTMGIYSASESATALFDAQSTPPSPNNVFFSAIQGISSFSQTTTYPSAVAANNLSLSSYYVVVSDQLSPTTGNMYKCSAGFSGMSCTQSGTTLVNNLVANNAGSLYGFSSNVNGVPTTQPSLVTSNDGSQWTTADQPLTNMPTKPALVQLAVSGTTVFAVTNGLVYYSTGGTTTIPPTTGTQQYDVAISSISMNPMSSITPGGTVTATVNVQNAGTQAIVTPMTVSVTVQNATVSNLATLPTGCFANGTTAVSCTINSLNVSQTQPLAIPFIAANLTSGSINVTANVTQISGETNTTNNQRSQSATLGTTTNPNATTNNLPVWSGGQTFYAIDLSTNFNNPNGVFSATDADGQTVSFTVKTNPTYGTLQYTSTTPGSAWTYKPSKTASTSVSDSFVVTMNDGVQSRDVSITISFNGNWPKKSSGGATSPFFILLAALGVAWMRRRMYQ